MGYPRRNRRLQFHQSLTEAIGPSDWKDVTHVEPRKYVIPNACSEVALIKKVSRRFLALLAKAAAVAI